MGVEAVAVADMNGDGSRDVVATNVATDSVSVLLVDGAGGVGEPGPSWPVGNGPYSIAVADLDDDDGNLDVVTGDIVGKTISVLLGDGAGGFRGPALSTPVGREVFSVVLADLDRDAHEDVVTARPSTNRVAVLYGDGAGGFGGQAATTPAGDRPESLAVADLNADGIPDIVAANRGEPTVSIMLGARGWGPFGPGSFGPPSSIRVPGGAQAVLVEDLNSDGERDLAVASTRGDVVSLLFGDGTGRFPAPAVPVPIGYTVRGLALGDIDGDGARDLVGADLVASALSVVRGDGEGGLRARPA